MAYHLKLSARRAAFQLWLNGVLLRRVEDAASPYAIVPIDRWLVDGSNALRIAELRLEPGPRSYFRAEVLSSESSGPVAQWEADGPLELAEQHIQFSCPAGTGPFAEGRCVELTQNDRTQILALIHDLHAAIAAGDLEHAIALLAHRIPFEASQSAISPDEAEAQMKEHLLGFSTNGFVLDPLPTLELSPVCSGSRVIVRDPTGRAAIVARCDGARQELSVSCGRVGSHWAVVA